MMKEVVGQYLDCSSLPNEVESLKDIIVVLSQALLKLWEEVDELKAENVVLRADNVLLRQENVLLRQENATLKAENAILRQENAALKAENALLREEIQALKSKVFGRKSEKSQKKSLGSGHKPANGNKHPGRQKGKEEWLRDRLVYDLPLAQKTCPHCQGFLSLIGEEISEQLEWVRPSLKVLEQVRLKYGCKICHTTVVTAPTPYKPIEKGLAGPNLIAHVVVSKFLDHLPLYRQEKIFHRYGLSLNRSTLCHWIKATAISLEPLYDLLQQELLLGNHLYSDDTGLPTIGVKAENQTNLHKTHKAYIWVYARDGHHGQQPIVVYEYALGRSGLYPQTFLKDFKGHLQADAYPGYDKLYLPDGQGKVSCIETGCWAHVRRKFIEALLANPHSIAQEIIALIDQLYEVDRTCKDQGLGPKAIYEQRQQQSQPILRAIYQWLITHQPEAVPKGLLGKAINYTLDNWSALTEFVKHGHLVLDNNFSERNIKLIVMGRKNYLFAGSPEGGKSAAILYSLIQTCQLNGVNPEEYLADVLLRIQYHPQARAKELLPQYWQRPQIQDQAA
jgi:transposase/cell division protein FtsB